MAKKYLDDTGLTYLWSKIKDSFQAKLVSGTNIKTINNESLLGSGNISISEGVSPDDYVVEKGTSAIWTYRKWNSGVAECWGIWSGQLANYATAFGGYAYYTNVSFPANLFTARPTLTYVSQVGGNFTLTGALLNLTANSTNLYAISPASGTQTVTFDIKASGRWK